MSEIIYSPEGPQIKVENTFSCIDIDVNNIMQSTHDVFLYQVKGYIDSVSNLQEDMYLCDDLEELENAFEALRPKLEEVDPTLPDSVLEEIHAIRRTAYHNNAAYVRFINVVEAASV